LSVLSLLALELCRISTAGACVDLH
jgi:hypothetical protein